MTFNPLINKTVRVEYPELIKFFYPNFKLIKDGNYDQPKSVLYSNLKKNNSIIYHGQYKNLILEKIEQKNHRIIHTITSSYDFDIDFKDRKNLLNFVFEKYDRNYEKEIPKIRRQYLESSNLSLENFYHHLKIFWFRGELPTNWSNDYQTKLNNLTEELEKKKGLEILFKLFNQKVSNSLIEYKIINFFEDSISHSENINISQELLLEILAEYRKIRNKSDNHKINLIYLISQLYSKTS